ncbi:MAG: helix-turn-helix domain-containing protein [Acidobacteriota bacterium]|nr:helix-turn-helix domain-containing protein [Acidobacteriota bacterium]
MKATKKVVGVTLSGGNVFADLGLAEAEDYLLKAQLALRIQQLIEQKGVTQAEIAPLLGLDQPKVSNLMRGRLAGFSVERLFGILNRLGHNVEVRISAEEYKPEDTYTTVVS